MFFKSIIVGLLLLVSLLVQGQTNAVEVFGYKQLSQFDNVRDFTLANDGSEAYITVQNISESHSSIVKLTLKDQEISKIELAPFSGEYRDLEPFLSPNNLQLYFVSNRPIEGGTNVKDYDIWYVERPTLNAPWGEAMNLGAPVNTKNNEFYPSVASNGNLYFTSDADAQNLDDIYFAKWSGSGYETPERLDSNINSKGYEYNCFISPNENILLFGAYNRPNGQGSGDIFISTRNANSNWEPAKPLPTPINSKQMDYCPFVDMKNNQLYFTSKRNAIAPIQNFKNVADIKRAYSSVENGQSRIYKIPFQLE